MGGAWREIAVWSRGRCARPPLTGPAVIEEAYTTVLLADGWTCGATRAATCRREGAVMS